MNIRGAASKDWQAIHDLLIAAGLPTEDLGPDRLSEFLVASDADDDLVAAIGLEQFGEIGLLRSLVVSETARAGGAGRRLVAALEEHARSLGESELWLLTIDADGYFAKLGYMVRERTDAPAEIRETREFSGLCPGDAALMSKKL